MVTMSAPQPGPPSGSLPEPLPGAVGLSHISAYDWLATDGVCGGSPHIHLACTEAYVVTAGEGAVQTLTPEGFTETPLEPGTIAWFTPGTVHRMVNGRDLRVTVLMQNSGLPEAGDAVFTFPPEILADPARYAEAAALPAREGPEAEAATRRRRDLAVEGYLVLRAALRAGDADPLRAFHEAAARLVAPKVALWRERWREGPLAAAEATGRHLDALARADGSHLAEAAVRSAGPTRQAGYGMCGRRQEYELPGTTLPRTSG
ncbi:cupin domain-containing protein [Streptomyces sp. ACA25]|uniref:cupin domain-containing protein n=1 Tax=Streptomyces sp. ACA25 TaxID=3022596 RepID=UPI0023079F02|nr:cupin domain-containing protein [Streptomyces sp. ACA25]MDB1088585.1 cupin domain-containing protein [Streptomyces sp. ACA25]